MMIVQPNKNRGKISPKEVETCKRKIKMTREAAIIAARRRGDTQDIASVRINVALAIIGMSLMPSLNPERLEGESRSR